MHVESINNSTYLRGFYDLHGIRIKSPPKDPPEKIPLNAIEREPVPTSVLNPNASGKYFLILNGVYSGRSAIHLSDETI